MDVKKIGAFLAQLRKEQNLTQEELGEKLGVTNKTVSRWENGNYLPPVEMLQELSAIYGLTINELLSAQVLPDSQYREKAEENIKSVLHNSAFTLNEKINYYKAKWKREHWTSLFFAAVIYILLIIFGWNNDSMLFQMIGIIFIFTVLIIRNNSMNIYVERHVYDTEDETAQASVGRKAIMKRIRITLLVLLAFSIWVCIDLASNYFASQVPQINDGITIRGFWAPLIFGMDGINWGILNYYLGFITSLQIAGGIGIVNVVMACLDIGKLNE